MSSFQAVAPDVPFSFPAFPVPDCVRLETCKSWNAAFLETWTLLIFEFLELPIGAGAPHFRWSLGEVP